MDAVCRSVDRLNESTQKIGQADYAGTVLLKQDGTGRWARAVRYGVFDSKRVDKRSRCSTLSSPAAFRRRRV